MNKNKIIFEFLHPEGCWHETEYSPMEESFRCVTCNEEFRDGDTPSYPGYTDPAQFYGMLQEFMKRGEKWCLFLTWAFAEKANENPEPDIVTWLLSDPERFCTLMCEWIEKRR